MTLQIKNAGDLKEVNDTEWKALLDVRILNGILTSNELRIINNIVADYMIT